MTAAFRFGELVGGLRVGALIVDECISSIVHGYEVVAGISPVELGPESLEVRIGVERAGHQLRDQSG